MRLGIDGVWNPHSLSFPLNNLEPRKKMTPHRLVPPIVRSQYRRHGRPCLLVGQDLCTVHFVTSGSEGEKPIPLGDLAFSVRAESRSLVGLRVYPVRPSGRLISPGSRLFVWLSCDTNRKSRPVISQ